MEGPALLLRSSSVPYCILSVLSCFSCHLSISIVPFPAFNLHAELALWFSDGSPLNFVSRDPEGRKKNLIWIMGYWKFMFIFFSVFNVLCFKGEMPVSQRGLLWPACLKQYPIPLPIRVLGTNMQTAEWRTLNPLPHPMALWGGSGNKDTLPPTNSLLLYVAMLCQCLATDSPNWEKHVEKGSEGIWRGWRRSPHTDFTLYLFTSFYFL